MRVFIVFLVFSANAYAGSGWYGNTPKSPDYRPAAPFEGNAEPQKEHVVVPRTDWSDSYEPKHDEPNYEYDPPYGGKNYITIKPSSVDDYQPSRECRTCDYVIDKMQRDIDEIDARMKAKRNVY